MSLPSAPRPLLLFSRPAVSQREPRQGYGTKPLNLPSIERQRERLAPQFHQLQRALEARAAELRADPTGTVPEQVLVLETAGSIEDFLQAVRRVPGMEWLAEWDEDELVPDEDFYRDEGHREQPISGRLYLVMANQAALTQLLSMWQRYQADPGASLERGLNKWRALFQHLRTVRTWNAADRLRDTGILDDWNERLQLGPQIVRFEVELWFKPRDNTRSQAFSRVASRLADLGGRAVDQATVADIRYHGVLAELPIQAIDQLLRAPETQAVTTLDDIMFFRPVGQIAAPAPAEEPEHLPAAEHLAVRAPRGEPRVALLDGMPLENHELLSGRLLIDDPDGWADDYLAADRQHGTAMASLMVHGELDAGEPPLSTPIYVRPVLRPDPRDPRAPRSERMPDGVLPVDLVHRAVRRLFEPEGESPPAAPGVKVINFSIGDKARIFFNQVSPLARLLDWLSWKYNVIFVVSCGNHSGNLVLDIPSSGLSGTPALELERAVLSSLIASARHRRLLSPAESINALTVGALHADGSTPASSAGVLDPLSTPGAPSPLNALGLGFRRSVKPEVLIAGGRQLFQEGAADVNDGVVVRAVPSSRAPGQRTAAPGVVPGDISATRHARGSSNAAALISRVGAQLIDVLADLRGEPDGEMINEKTTSVLLKALLVHSSRWGDCRNVLESLLRVSHPNGKLRENAARFLGYGAVDAQRVFGCTDQRATLLACDQIGEGEAHTYSLPLPPSLAGQRLWRRLTLTLAWLSSINPLHRSYRQAALRLESPLELLAVDRKDADGNAVLRGTVQHEVLEGRAARAFADGEALRVRVTCRADGGNLVDQVPYAVAATLEVAEDIALPIYEEIRSRIRPSVQIAPRPG